MKVIGLTGPTGAGKSCCGRFFEKKNIPTINADEVYHNLINGPSECVAELVEFFGVEILAPDGSVNRKALAKCVFGDVSATNIETLNRITHKYVHLETLRLLDQFRKPSFAAVIVDAPLLFEASFDKFCDFTVAILAPRELRRARIMKRDNLTPEEADRRLNAQKPDDYYSSRAQHILISDSTEETLCEKLKDIFVQEGVAGC